MTNRDGQNAQTEQLVLNKTGEFDGVLFDDAPMHPDLLRGTAPRRTTHSGKFHVQVWL